MRVALVTSAGACGIAAHSDMLMSHARLADPSIEYIADPMWLDPAAFLRWQNACAMASSPDIDVLHLNYHRGLHSRWTPDVIGNLGTGHKVVITFHDTYEVHQPDDVAWGLLHFCDRMIVHEPCDLYSGLGAGDRMKDIPKVRYWRQGVLDPDGTQGSFPHYAAARPYVGTFGFAFPWKGFDLLAEAAAQAGWGVRILSHTATDEDRIRWCGLNPWVDFSSRVNGHLFIPAAQVIAELQACDATAFLYQCANTGTSGALRLGIAAGKPVLATVGCRQFRDLQELDLGIQEGSGIIWTDPSVERVGETLSTLTLERFNPGIVRLRERDNWRHLGVKYAALYQELLG